MKTLLSHCAAACLTTLLAGAACAQTRPAASPAPAPAASPADSPTVDKDYKLVHKSSFEGSAEDRSPFWPIGWKPTPGMPNAPVTQRRETVPDVQPENFVVTTISLQSDGALAVINGLPHAVGDRLPVDASGRYFVTVKQILDGAVVLDFNGKQIRVSNNRRGK